MSENKNVDKTISPCDSSNLNIQDKCFMELLSLEMGCNLPWLSIKNGKFLNSLPNSCKGFQAYFKYLSPAFSDKLKECSQIDDEVLKYASIMKSPSSEFKNKIKHCQIPNCHTKRYKTHEFYNRNAENQTQTVVNTHGFIVQSNEVKT